MRQFRVNTGNELSLSQTLLKRILRRNARHQARHRTRKIIGRRTAVKNSRIADWHQLGIGP